MPGLENGPNFKQFMSEWNAEHPEGDEKPAEAKKAEKPTHSQKEVEEAFFEAGDILNAAIKSDQETASSLEDVRTKINPPKHKEGHPSSALMADRKAMSALKPDATVIKESKGFFARMLEKVGIKQSTVAEQEAAKQKKAEKMFGEKFMDKHEDADLRKSELRSRKTLEQDEAETTMRNLEKGAKMEQQAELNEMKALGKKGREELRTKMDKEAEDARIKEVLAAEGHRGTPEQHKHAEF